MCTPAQSGLLASVQGAHDTFSVETDVYMLAASATLVAAVLLGQYIRHRRSTYVGLDSAEEDACKPKQQQPQKQQPQQLARHRVATSLSLSLETMGMIGDSDHDHVNVDSDGIDVEQVKVCDGDEDGDGDGDGDDSRTTSS